MLLAMLKSQQSGDMRVRNLKLEPAMARQAPEHRRWAQAGRKGEVSQLKGANQAGCFQSYEREGPLGDRLPSL